MNPVKSFEIRWSDLDANRHVANTAYAALMNERRVTYLSELGFDQEALDRHNLGPVLLWDEFYYLKEVLPGETVHISVEQAGHSEGYRHVRWCHHLYNQAGKLAVYSEVMLAWMDLGTRKLVLPPPALADKLAIMPRYEPYALLTEQDIRKKTIPKRELPARP